MTSTTENRGPTPAARTSALQRAIYIEGSDPGFIGWGLTPMLACDAVDVHDGEPGSDPTRQHRGPTPAARTSVRQRAISIEGATFVHGLDHSSYVGHGVALELTIASPAKLATSSYTNSYTISYTAHLAELLTSLFDANEVSDEPLAFLMHVLCWPEVREWAEEQYTSDAQSNCNRSPA